MSTVPRGWRTEEDRRLADAARWPVLVRLPDASTDAPTARFAKPSVPGGPEYRFDPPQSKDSSARPVGSIQSTTSKQPHVFDRSRPKGQRGIPRRAPSVLPQTNPFSNPRPRLIDSVAPAVRFLTMVALFTAAGIWIQMLGRHAQPTASTESSTTAVHPAAVPAKNAGDHTQPGPTATGPIERQPEPDARVGRADGDDFASQNNSAAGPVPTARPTLTPPHFLISAGSHVPRVRVADLTNGAESGESAEVARCPGFDSDNPTR
jgi:hypothetical protein